MCVCVWCETENNAAHSERAQIKVISFVAHNFSGGDGVINFGLTERMHKFQRGGKLRCARGK